MKTRIRWTVARELALVIPLLALLGFAYTVALPEASDWEHCIRPAAVALARGASPYVPGFFNPPWAAAILVPLALLPTAVGKALLLIAGIAALAYIVYRLGGNHVTTALFVVSPPILIMLFYGNIDWLALLGALFAPPVGVILLTIKPQATIGVLIYWAILAWQRKEIIETFAPTGLLFAASLSLYGFWPARLLAVPGFEWNVSMWPWSIPVGVALVAYAVHKRDVRFALAASPFLSPYCTWHSWCVVLLPLVDRPVAMAVAVAGMWAVSLLAAGL